MTTQCFSPFQAQLIRATRLDSCGAIVPGTKGQIVSDALISVELKANWDDGTDVLVKNAAGAVKLDAPGKPTLNYFDVTLTMTNVDPELFEMVTSQSLISDGMANVIGISQREFIPAQKGIALETWSLAGNEQGVCALGAGITPYGYFLLPQLVNGKIGDVTLNDGAMDCVLMGRTRRGSQWGVGPSGYKVMDVHTTGTTVTPGQLLTPVTADEHMRMFQTPVPPPTPACGAVVLAA